MRDHGAEAFARPGSTHPNGGYTFDQNGMSYRDWLVGGMLREYFLRAMTMAAAHEELYEALIGEERMRAAVLKAHVLADIIIEERYK
jgi:hypothetical protein